MFPCLLLIAYCLLPIAYCLLLIAYCLLPIAYCLLFHCSTVHSLLQILKNSFQIMAVAPQIL
ncbi:MAG: hypothetical protein COX07_01365 [Bacteroidetes bacterium CG23_combo_of_CG06-09_8_20_14_all_32_9]|nr:MAG: hypothetical protein COX07_01365 [Bacteroidetes bacterium CG23_combo_of_CG06-09_8_20_14_all_32_9]